MSDDLKYDLSTVWRKMGVSGMFPIRHRENFTAPGFIREMIGNNIFKFNVNIPERVEMPLCGVGEQSGIDLWRNYALVNSFYGLAYTWFNGLYPPFFALLVAQILNTEEIETLAKRMVIEAPTKFYQAEHIWEFMTLTFLKSASQNFYLFEYYEESLKREGVLYGKTPKRATDVLGMRSLEIKKRLTQEFEQKLLELSKLIPKLPRMPVKSQILRDYWDYKICTLAITDDYGWPIFRNINLLVVLRANPSLLVEEFLSDYNMIEKKVDILELLYTIKFEPSIEVVQFDSETIRFDKPIKTFKDLENTTYYTFELDDGTDYLPLMQVYTDSWAKMASLGK